MVFNMRSELLVVDNRSKIEQQQPQSLRRRRMAAAAVNGADKANLQQVDSMVRQVSLAAAFHDHMSCTKSAADLCKFQEFSEVSLPCETDHIYANCSDSPKNVLLRDETRLKDMLLLHLDLIQHQQEQIQKKDQQIHSLKQENESLKIRLERMDRRMSLLKQKKEFLSSSESNSSPENHLSASKQASENRAQRLSGRSAKRSFKKEDQEEEEEDVAKSEKCARISANFRRKSGEDEEIEFSQNCYYSLIGETLPENSRVSFPIEVPTWRYHPVSSCYQLEGTENIDDDIFLRRHLKLEQDERRRKRWDMQRLREQRHNEKLRRGRYLQKDLHKYHTDTSSFFPSPKDVQYIEVTESVPVVAFGHPIPKLQPCEFSLEWYSGARNSSEEARTKLKKCRSNGQKRGT